MTRFENVGVFVWENGWLENSLSQLRLFLSQTFSPINTPTFLEPSHSAYLSAYEDGTDRVFRNVGT